MDSQQIINNFTGYLKRKNKSKSTVTAYKKDIEQLAESNINKSLVNFTENDIRYALTFLQNAKALQLKSVSRKLNSIRTFYKYLEEKKIINANPSKRISHPKFRAKKQRFLTRMEYLALREVSRDNERLYMMIEVLLQTGIRIGELSRLKCKDLNLDSKRPTMLVEEFASNPERIIPLNEKITLELKKYLTQIKAKNSQPLFSTKSGKNIEIRNIRSSIDRAIIKAKIRNACVNDLRNTFIVNNLSTGMSLSKVAEIVGHKNILTTQRYVELLAKKYKPNGVESVVEL